MKALNEFLNESNYPKTERGWDKKFKEVKKVFIDGKDFGLESEEFIERIQSANGMSAKDNDMEGKVDKDNFEKLSDDAWSKLKGDTKKKEVAIREYIDGGWI